MSYLGTTEDLLDERDRLKAELEELKSRYALVRAENRMLMAMVAELKTEVARKLDIIRSFT